MGEEKPSVLHIPGLARNLIFVSTMGDESVQTIFEKDTCKMVRGAMVLMWGVRIGIMYKMLGETDGGICNKVVVL